MGIMKVLVIDHDPLPGVLSSAAASAGISLEVHVAKNYTDALDWLYIAGEFDAIFICYRFRNGDNAVDSLLVRYCIHSGFGGSNGKPLVAFSRDPEGDQKLLMAGCNRFCDRVRVREFFLSEFIDGGGV